MKHLTIIIVFFSSFNKTSFGQELNNFSSSSIITAANIEDSSKNNSRKFLIGGISIAGYAGSLIALNETWYKNHERSSFHSFNDSKEWLQVDKMGHAWSAYNLSRATTAAWKWAGLTDNKAVVVGSLSGFGYLTVVEILDGHSARWGWSWADMGANFAGSSLFAAQELAWKEQKILFKFSAHKKNYPPDLQLRADGLFGSSLPERILKDYNTHTYWLSFNLQSFYKRSSLPLWLNIAVGYGADGMFGGFQNIGHNSDGDVTFYRPDIKRQRQWYLAPDIDLTKIQTKSKFLKTTFSIFNSIKIPAPTLELTDGKIKGKWLHF